jgi:hypothetical protein
LRNKILKISLPALALLLVAAYVLHSALPFAGMSPSRKKLLQYCDAKDGPGFLWSKSKSERHSEILASRETMQPETFSFIQDIAAGSCEVKDPEHVLFDLLSLLSRWTDEDEYGKAPVFESDDDVEIIASLLNHESEYVRLEAMNVILRGLRDRRLADVCCKNGFTSPYDVGGVGNVKRKALDCFLMMMFDLEDQDAPPWKKRRMRKSIYMMTRVEMDDLCKKCAAWYEASGPGLVVEKSPGDFYPQFKWRHLKGITRDIDLRRMLSTTKGDEIPEAFRLIEKVRNGRIKARSEPDALRLLLFRIGQSQEDVFADETRLQVVADLLNHEDPQVREYALTALYRHFDMRIAEVFVTAGFDSKRKNTVVNDWGNVIGDIQKRSLDCILRFMQELQGKDRPSWSYRYGPYGPPENLDDLCAKARKWLFKNKTRLAIKRKPGSIHPMFFFKSK